MRKILTCLFLSMTALNGLELNRVILSTNDDPLYIEFWPVVAPIWEAMGLRPTLALIANEDCPIDTSIGDVIRFAPIPGVTEALQSQAIRLLLPILYPDEGCLLSDIDMIPISKSYFVDNAKDCPDDTMLIYRDKADEYQFGRFPMCYVAAKGRVFGEVFDIQSADDIRQQLIEWSELGYGWNTDEIVLSSHALFWEQSRGGHLIRLGHSVSGRLDRSTWFSDIPHLDITNYIDCHSPRPYTQYKPILDLLITEIFHELALEKN
ncbi:MAG: hypothetical protein V4492_06260 [Chlamydiota bacterium]